MNKIPVSDTISRTYNFGFSNILSIFGIAWLPYTLLALIAVGLIFLLAPDFLKMVMQGQFDVPMLLHVGHIFGLIGLLSFIVGSMVMVGIQRKALGKHPGPVFVYFSLGAPVWRMAGAWFLAGLVIFFIGLLTAGVVGAIWFAAGQFAANFATLIRTITIVAACLWFIYMMVRLTFFLPAVVVAEERIGLGRAWELDGGNFWRIFVISIAVFLPVSIGLGIVSSTLFGSMFVMPNIHDNMDVHEVLRTVFQQMRVVGPFMVVFQIIERIVFLGLGNGMIANAYLSVTGASGSGAEPAASTAA
jgi:hypothetical protein